MSNSNAALALALGAGGGFLLSHLLRDDDEDTPTASPAAPALTPPPGPCSLRLDAAGLTADGERVDPETAVARCLAAGRAELFATSDAPGAVYADLMTVLTQAGVSVSARRNGAAPRRPRQRRQATGAVDLAAFARTVLALAQQIDADPTVEGHARGRFGRKVFLAAVRCALAGSEYARLSRATVDRLLIDAHREGLVELARADLVAAMDPAEVRDSEVRHLEASYHFVVAERAEGRNAATYRRFALRTYPDGRMRWYRADSPTTWEDAKRRLVAAGVLDDRVSLPTDWVLTGDPPFRIPEERWRPLPGGEG